MEDQFPNTNSPPPMILKQGDLLHAEEDRMTEFKAVQFTKRLIETVLKLAQEYINAFLNTDGGAIYFGLELSVNYFSDLSCY